LLVFFKVSLRELFLLDESFYIGMEVFGGLPYTYACWAFIGEAGSLRLISQFFYGEKILFF
jgi:hypothetical protein